MLGYNIFKMSSCAACSVIQYPDNKVILEYIYLDRCKLIPSTKTCIADFEPKGLKDLTMSHASVTKAGLDDIATIDDLKESLLIPVAMYKDPFRMGHHKLILCEVMNNLEEPSDLNTRHEFVSVAEKVWEHEVQVGFEQEYIMEGRHRDSRGVHPTSFTYHNKLGMMDKTGFERHIVEQHLACCLYAGINMYGINREVAESQWEYQVGPGSLLSIADDLVVSRYILARISEMHDVTLNFDPHPATSYFSSSLHIGFSTRKTRDEGGIKYINSLVEKLSKIDQAPLLASFDRRNGSDNRRRMVGQSHRPSPDVSVGDRNNSVRIPLETKIKGRGYFEERRPSSDADPYTLLKVYIHNLLLD